MIFEKLWWSLKVQFAKIPKSKYEGISKTFAFEILWTSPRVNRLDRLGVKNSNNSGSFCNVGSQVWWWLLLHLLIKLVMLRKKLGDASYDFAKEVDWNNGLFLQAPGIRALGGWARGFAVGLGRVMFADVCLGWFLVIFLPNKVRVWHDVSNLAHQITSRAVDRRFVFFFNDRSLSVVIWRLIIKHIQTSHHLICVDRRGMMWLEMSHRVTTLPSLPVGEAHFSHWRHSRPLTRWSRWEPPLILNCWRRQLMLTTKPSAALVDQME